MAVEIKRKIRICYVITRMDWGGAPDLVRMLCMGLPPERFEVTLVTGRTRSPSRKTREFFAAFKGKVVVVPGLQREVGLFRDLGALLALHRVFRRGGFDIIHTHTAKAGFLGRTAAFFCGCRCIVHTPHGHNFYGYFGRLMTGLVIRMERCAAMYTRVIVALTGMERDDYRRFRICPAAKVALIPTAIGPEFFTAADTRRVKACKAWGADGRLVGFVGRLEPVKGPEYFLAACREIAAAFPEARFVITGEGSLREKLLTLACSYGLKERVVFTGWQEEVSEVISCLEVLVQPSLNEAVGLVLLEAQALGVPVVASRVGGIAEAVQDGRTAILVPPADSAAIARAVIGLLKDVRAAKEMGRCGQGWVRGRFTAGEMVRRHEELYHGLLEGR